MSDAERLMRESIETKERFLREGGGTVLQRMADAIVGALRRGKRIYVCGNGGSAADAQHIAGELIGRFMRERAPLPCIALTTDTSVLTAIANDYSFDAVFERQVIGLVAEGDVLLALSTSGRSANVVRAVQAARARGAVTLGFSGRDGGRLLELCDLCLVAPSDVSARIQEVHITAAHILCELVERDYFASQER